MTALDQKRKSDTAGLWRVSGLGMELAGAVVGMTLVGWALDRWLGTSPRWILICGAVGIIGGGYNFIRAALAMNKQAASQYRSEHEKRPVKENSEPVPKADSESISRELESFRREMKQKIDDARRDTRDE